MSRLHVYLSGTISREKEHNSWRSGVVSYFRDCGVRALDPMRGKSLDDIDQLGLENFRIPASQFVRRDEQDIRRCDGMLLLFWRGVARQSIGTWAELGLAHAWNKPIVIVSDDPTVVAHPFVKTWAAYIVDASGDAGEKLKARSPNRIEGALEGATRLLWILS